MLDFDYDVVIPTRGRTPGLLDETLRSVYRQTIAARRVIIVVDGDADAGADIRERWPKAQVVDLDRPTGAAAARQAGIEASTAEWICFVDDDDVWARGKSEATAAYIAAHPECRAVRATYLVFADQSYPGEDFNGQLIDVRGGDLDELSTRSPLPRSRNDFSYLDIRGHSLERLLDRNRSVIGTTCVRRDLLMTLPPVPRGTRPGDDHLLACLVATQTEWHLIDEPLMFYRLHRAQDSRSVDPRGVAGILRSRAAAWRMCGPFTAARLVDYGPAYRREFRALIWPLLRDRQWSHAAAATRLSFGLLPRWRDRALFLVPEPLVWRWRHRARRTRGYGRTRPRPSAGAGPTSRPALSVCIVTYERPAFLERCLRALERHLSADVQVVVVDASARGSSALVERIRASTVYLHDPSVAGWMTRARNVALLHATGEVISFLDDDVVIGATWEQAVLDSFADPTVDAVAGRTRNLQPGEESYDLPIGSLRPDGSLTEGFAALSAGRVDVDHGIGANMSFRRTILARLGGFRDDYPGTAMREDTDIYLRIGRLGGRAVFVPDAVVDHLPAPHVRGARFDTRYKLYARRNHVVLLARHEGLRSRRLRRWVAREYRSVGEAGSLSRRVERWGVTTLGIAWGTLAALRQARWGPLPPERTDRAGMRIRAALSG